MSNFSGMGNGVEAWGNTVNNWGSSNTGMGAGGINLGAGSKANHIGRKFSGFNGNLSAPTAFSHGSVNMGPGGKNAGSAAGGDSSSNHIRGEFWGGTMNPGSPYGPANYGPGAGGMNDGPSYGSVNYFNGSHANWSSRFPHGGAWHGPPGHFFGTWTEMPRPPGDGFWYSAISASCESGPNSETPRRVRSEDCHSRECNEWHRLRSHK